MQRRSDRIVGVKIKNHPPTAANEIIRGAIKKIEMGNVVKGVIQKERRIANVMKKEARAERTMGLTELKILADARRDKTAVIPR